MRNLVYELYISIILPIKEHPFRLFGKIFTCVGVYCSLCEFEQLLFKTTNLVDFIRNYRCYFLLFIYNNFYLFAKKKFESLMLFRY